MLFVSPKGLLGSRFELSSDGVRTIGLIELLLAKTYSRITIGTQVYRASFHGTLEKRYVLKTISEEVYAAAAAPLLAGRFDLHFKDRLYSLRADSGIRNPSYILLDGEKHIGSIRTEGFFRRRFLLDCPDKLPLAIQAFLVWMVIMALKHASTA
jgi:hypothetical protein